jgi:hypothetical protein
LLDGGLLGGDGLSDLLGGLDDHIA